jgi:hypothetical protein
MNVSEKHGEMLKSQRQRELDELRNKGLAKTRRIKLNDCKLFASRRGLDYCRCDYNTLDQD